MAGTWINDDGLKVKFGTTKSEVGLGGESTTDGNDRVLTFDFTYADLAATGTTKYIPNVSIPNGAVLREAKLHISTAWTSGGSATLTIGLYDTDESTAYDADGIDATIAVAAMTEGTTITCDGAVVGKAISNTTPVIVSLLEGTAAFTAGAAQLVVKYYIP